jgi:hypothetical protein
MLGVLAAALVAATPGYEDQLVQWGLEQQQRELEPNPEGKQVEEVLVAIEDVFAPSDPWPTMFLNHFHWKTKETIVRREILLKPGDTWDKSKVDESERNLRAHTILAVARVVTVKGKDGGVALLVVTKDRWSLRLEWSYLLVGNVLEYLDVPLTEINFLGRDLQLVIEPLLRRDTLELAEGFQAPRIWGSKVQFTELLSIVINRATAKPEGTLGQLEVNQPLLSLDQSWGFDVGLRWNVRRQRTYRGNDIWELGYPDDKTATTSVPYIYDARTVDAWALLIHSWGTRWKLNLTGGPGGYVHDYHPPPEEKLDPMVQRWFISNWLPHSETATYLYAATRLYLAEYTKMHDLDTFALTEDVRLGPSLHAGFLWSLPTSSAVTPYLSLTATGTYNFVFHDDWLSLQAGAMARVDQYSGDVHTHYAFQVTNYSPKLEGGRFVVHLLGDFRVNDIDNTRVLLGGGNGLRGVPPEALTGRNELLGNFEYRTRAFVIATVHVGFVLFYDVGSAFDASPQLVHTVGAGLRILFPQLNTQVIRIDFGFVLGSTLPVSLQNLSSTFGQVTQLGGPFTSFSDPSDHSAPLQ